MATPAATITMSMREADRLKTIQAAVDRMARVGQAAQRLGLSRRQLERLIQRYKDDGVAGLVSRKRGRPSNHQLAPGIAERAIGLIRERYADFDPTLACEKLTERGVHSTEFGFEKDLAKIQLAMSQLKVNYPVAVDRLHESIDLKILAFAARCPVRAPRLTLNSRTLWASREGDPTRLPGFTISQATSALAAGQPFDNAISPLSDVVLGCHRLAVAQEHPYTGIHLLVGQRGAGALVQVVGPGGDDKSLDIARRIAEVAIDAP
jgi:hypothetical protein